MLFAIHKLSTSQGISYLRFFEIIGFNAFQVGLTLRDVPICPSINAPLSQIVLAKAMELFVAQLSRESLASALMR